MLLFYSVANIELMKTDFLDISPNLWRMNISFNMQLILEYYCPPPPPSALLRFWQLLGLGKLLGIDGLVDMIGTRLPSSVNL